MLNSLTFSIVFLFIAGFVLYSVYPELIAYLKTTPFSKYLAGLSKSKVQTLLIFIAVCSASAIIFLILGTYILSRPKVTEFVQRIIFKTINSGKTIPLGLMILSIVVLFNLFMFGYAHLNRPDGPNVILISIDTLRADHLGSYGYGRNTSPNIDKLAEEGVLFENAFTQAPWTLPAMATIHTSLYPSEHGATRYNLKLKDNFITLAEYMRNNFYKTIGIISTPYVSSKYGFSQGYDIFEEYIMGTEGTSSEHLTERAIEYISDNQDNKFFLWIHYFDPHAIYLYHEDYNYGRNYSGNLPANLSVEFLKSDKNSFNTEDIEYVKDIYDEEISYTDHNIGKLINNIEELGLKEDTVIIITADHGEEFMERNGFGHGKSVYNELIRIPLIIYNPYKQKQRIEENVETRSIPKTILELSGIDSGSFGGENLLALDQSNIENYIYSEGTGSMGENTLREAIVLDQFKLIKNIQYQTFELYDLRSDPNEKINLFNTEQINIKSKQNELMSKLSKHQKQRLGELQKVELSKEDIKRLKALGYIQ
ncbi:MAG: sulfatase [Candidatus Dadabacteria bacterium]|nr:sulfatase [Candidatus Dadabacteria bacterium]